MRDLKISVFVAAFALVLFALTACGKTKAGQETDPNIPDPRVCITIDGNPVDMTANEAVLLIVGQRCIVTHDRQGNEVQRDCGVGALTLMVDSNFPNCLNVMDAANTDTPISYTWFHPCTGVVHSEDVWLLEDTDVNLGTIPSGYCEYGVPQCENQPVAVWSQPFSDSLGLSFDGATLEECCEYPGAGVQDICGCPTVFRDCSVDSNGDLEPDLCVCRDWIPASIYNDVPGLEQCTVNTDDDGLYDDLCVCGNGLSVCDVDTDSDGVNDHCTCG